MYHPDSKFNRERELSEKLMFLCCPCVNKLKGSKLSNNRHLVPPALKAFKPCVLYPRKCVTPQAPKPGAKPCGGPQSVNPIATLPITFYAPLF